MLPGEYVNPNDFDCFIYNQPGIQFEKELKIAPTGDIEILEPASDDDDYNLPEIPDEVEEEEELEGEMEMICHNLQRSTALARIDNTFKRPERNGDNRLASNRVFAPVVGDYNFNTFNSLSITLLHISPLLQMI